MKFTQNEITFFVPNSRLISLRQETICDALTVNRGATILVKMKEVQKLRKCKISFLAEIKSLIVRLIFLLYLFSQTRNSNSDLGSRTRPEQALNRFKGQNRGKSQAGL